MATNPSSASPLPGKRRVVVAEDNPITRRLLTTWIEESGYEVQSASNGQEAIALIDSSNPSILVTDWNMPEVSGLELCEMVRGDSERPYVYILMVTSREDRKDVVQAIDAGADDFVVKPVKAEELLARVGQAEAALKRFNYYVERAETDTLTGAVNRRRFNEHCVRQIALAARNNSSLSCVLLDIDLFKHINDTYGHSIGDEALRAVSGVLEKHTRHDDCICRYGGDEFCILLPGIREADALGVAERIRSSVCELGIPASDRTVELRVTLGVSEWRQDIMTPRQLIDLADEALLAAKQSGRDRVIGYGDLTNLRCLDDTPILEYQKQFAEVVASDIMTTPVVTLLEDQPLHRAVDLFLRLRINVVPIVDYQSRLVGIISEKDVLNSVGIDDDWTRPIREVMKTNIACYSSDTPVVIIWEFLQRVTLRQVIVVDRGMPTGMISRGSLLRWLGNWGVFLAQHERSENLEQLGMLCTHIQGAAASIGSEAQRLQSQVVQDADSTISVAINAATRLQEQAQNLLALCQVNYKFEPRSPAKNSPEVSLEAPAT